MISPSARWRFVEELADRTYYEDEIVQHQLIEFRALRRSFSEKFCKDPVALEEARRQARLAARNVSSLLPVLFCQEEIEGRHTVVMELVKGDMMRDRVAREEFKRPRKWFPFAQKLLEELIDGRSMGARYDRLSLDHLVISPSGEFRVSTRFPVGRVAPDVLESSPMLQRLEAMENGGVYTSNAPPDEIAELKAICEVLTKAAAGSVSSGYKELRQIAMKNPKMYPSELAGIEKAVAEILLRLSGDSSAPGIMTLEALRDEIRRNTDSAVSADPRSGAAPQLEYVSVPETYSPSKPKSGIGSAASSRSPSPDPSSARSSDRLAKMSGLDTGDAPKADTKSPVSPDPGSAPQLKPKKQKTPSIEEDFNPYASAEEVSEKKKEESSKPILAPVASNGGGGKSKILLYVGGGVLLALGGLIVVAFVLPMLQASAPNEPPIAGLAELESRQFRINEPVPLDASPSKDPEGAELTYYWTIISPSGSTGIFTEVATERFIDGSTFATKTPNVTLQMQSSGIYVLELKVNDMKQTSRSVNTSFEILPLQE